MKTQNAILLLITCAGLVGNCVAAPRDATPPADDAAIYYAADWYRAFAPRTALDMVRQTPGFVLEEGAQRRGLAGALGNVLVDGRRATAKAQTLEDVLGRIPASQVERIEILRGAAAAGDASGRATLLNVVRIPFSGQGFGSVGAEYAQQDKPMPNAVLVWTGRAHAVDYAIGANSFTFARELPGTRHLTGVSGESTGTREDQSPRDYGQYSMNGEASADMGGGRLRLTGRAFYSRYHEDSNTATHDAADALLGTDFNPYTETRRDAELGGQYDRQIGEWELAAVGLFTHDRFEGDITSTHHDPAGTVGSVFQQGQLHDSTESILRGTLARHIASHRFELGLEGALNTLDAQLALTLDLGNGPFAIPVPNSNVRIEEKRVDGFLSDTWSAGAAWTFDWRLAGEYSRLEFTGDSNQVVKLAFAKPSLQLTRAFGKSNQWRLRVERDVGQLDFTDFVSSASLTDKRIDGGNPDLRPQTQWSIEASADLRPAADVGLTLAAFHRWVSDTADFTPVGPPQALVDAPGNIGDARIYGAQITARVPLRFMRGTALNADATWQHSAVVDPLTQQTREISNFRKFVVKAGLRQDLPKLAWGVNYAEKSALSAYLLREIDRKGESPSLDLFAELPLAHGVRVKAEVISLLGQPETRDRFFFDPDRSVPGSSAERSARDPGRWFQLSVSGSF